MRQNPRTKPARRDVESVHTTRWSPNRTVFDTLSERLRKTLGNLTGRGRISEAAKVLGIQRTNLYRKIRVLHVERGRKEPTSITP